MGFRGCTLFAPTVLLVVVLARVGSAQQPDPNRTVGLGSLSGTDSLGSRSISATEPTNPNELIRLGRFDDAIEVLTTMVASDPMDQASRYKLVLVYLKLHRPIEAAAELQTWKNVAPGPSSLRSSIESLVPVLEMDPKREVQLRRQLRLSLDQHHAGEAVALINQMAVGESSREILKAQIYLYQANFVAALSSASKIAKVGDDSERTVAKQLASDITTSFREYNKLNLGLNRFLDAQLSVSSCSPTVARKAVAAQQFSLQDYVRLVVKSNRIYPLNSHFEDLKFHAGLISALPYKDLEALGDRILDAKGTLQIPFYSRDKLFRVVIDRARHRIYTEPTSPDSNVYGTSDLEALVPFDLAFADIREIRQKIRTDRALLGIANGGSVLMVGPGGGDAPYYSLMHLSQCLYGDVAQRTASRNLAVYFSHVIDNPKVRVGLTNADGGTDWIATTSKMIGGVGVGAALAAGFSPPSSNTNPAQNGMTPSQIQAMQQKMMSDSIALLEVSARELIRQSELTGSESVRSSLFNMLRTKGFLLVDPKLPPATVQGVDELLRSI